MILFRLPLTMALLVASLILLIGGSVSKKGHVLSFLGAVCCVLSILCGLIGGAPLRETLLYALSALGVSCAGDMRKGGRG